MRSTGDARKDYLIAFHMAKPGYRGKIDAFCIHCIFDSEGGGGGWRQQVAACTATDCPLFSSRAKSDATVPDDD